MKLLQTSLTENFTDTIQSWKDEVKDSGAAIFHVYVPYNQENIPQKLNEIRTILQQYTPEIPVIGCSATGEIVDGRMLDDDSVVTLMIFEEPTTRVEVMSFTGKTREIDYEWLFKYASKIPDLKGIEVLTAADYQELDIAGRAIDQLPEIVEVFGAVAVGDDNHKPFIFTNDFSYSLDKSAIVLYSGSELHFQTDRILGWKAIGYPLKVTKVDGAVVYELDGKPAYDVYNHYLQIKKDSNFFYNALEFPWEVRVDEETAYIRHAKSVNPDGSIVMSSDIPQGSDIRLTYGDPRRIIEHTKQTGIKILDFAPQVVYVINCMGRKLFWGGEDKVEIAEISRYLHTTGFSALGEIMRYRGTTFLNNLSIVTVAMREGPAKDTLSLDIEKMEQVSDMSIMAQLAIFINTITDELMEKNEQLNEMLYKASHDALTGLYNRGAIERIIYEGAEADDEWYLIMFDIDDFKQINDRLGHGEGDKVLIMIAETLSDYLGALRDVSAGRWGGEEFMLFVKGYKPSEVKEVAENIASHVKNNQFTKRAITISAGITAHHKGEDVIQTITRVDELMYMSKNNGKDQVTSDL